MLGDGLRVFDPKGTEINPDNKNSFDENLAAILYAIPNVFHQTYSYSPAQIVFGRDMFLDASPEINWDEICQQKQEKIGISNRRENSNRIDHT